MKLKNIKDKFKRRDIKPSADSWEKLSERLDNTDKQKKKPIVMWMGAVAAILILGLIIVPSLFFNGNVIPVKGQIVIEEMDQTDQVDSVDGNNPNIQAPVTDKEPVDEVAVRTEAIATTESSTNSKKKPVIVKEPFLKQDLAVNNPNDDAVPFSVKLSDIAVAEPDIIINTKEPVVINEAELLLNRALQNVQVTKASATRIDPDKLLRETEWDLEAKKNNRLENTLLDGLGRLKREAVAFIDR